MSVLGALQLHFEPLHANLKAVHGLDGRLGTLRVIEAHETWQNSKYWSLARRSKSIIIRNLTEALALIRGSIDENLRRYHVSERHEHLHQFSVTKFLWQMINEQVAAIGTFKYEFLWKNELTNLSKIKLQLLFTFFLRLGEHCGLLSGDGLLKSLSIWCRISWNKSPLLNHCFIWKAFKL